MKITEVMLSKMFRVSRQRLAYWRRIELLPKRVAGTKQGYTFRDVLMVKVVVALTTAGMRPSRIKQSLDALDLMLHKEDAWKEKSIYVCGKELFVFEKGKAIEPLTGQYLLFTVDGYKENLRSTIIKIQNKLQSKKSMFITYDNDIKNIEKIYDKQQVGR